MVPLVSPSLLVLLLYASSAAAEPLHIPLSRRAPVTEWTMDKVAATAENIRFKYGYKKPDSRRAVNDIPITNQGHDTSYYGALTVGTPAQQVNVILDTGSSDLWVGSSFNPTASSTFTRSDREVGITYGSGNVNGTFATDTVTMGGFTVPEQGFLVATQISSGIISTPVGGLMGLAFAPNAATNSTPFWQTLVANGQLSSSEMSFWLTRATSSSDSDVPGGVFTLGGTNSSLYTGDIEFTNLAVTPPFYWLLSLTGVTVQGNNVPVTTGSSAFSAIDTGTTLIGGPSADVKAIYTAIPGSQPIQGAAGYYSFPCSTNVSITLAFGGKAWPINPVDMNHGPVSTGSSDCVGAIFDLTAGTNITVGSGNPGWVVGDTFLKNVYTVFRAVPQSVGFAALSATAGRSGPWCVVSHLWWF